MKIRLKYSVIKFVSILDQAETNGPSKIWIRYGTPLELYIRRRWVGDQPKLFHKELVKVFKAYVDDLRQSSPDEGLGENFVAKMKCVCRSED